ncbi:Putative peroxiredoxin bcp [Hydrogenovibrio crunogenus]|uniref:Peroxiredoxin bcp n=1 Tax=Hydrogenovibrio crunogenus TaxID=39765 RepID=A0A4P7NZR0_9GAMM|nr:peroxiredoxin [Hydrogenovibrio crunogenus]QBZ83351.1 Putative peroxiredoxin bcp [Hydrogenovibrio crunogenus]
MKDLHKLPDDLPVPVDDGACDHLLDSIVPSVALKGVSDTIIDLSSIEGMVVIFFYPMNGRPDSPPMIGWNDIPGARGCTPQSCSFRDNYSQLEKLGVKLFGVSSQPLKDQKEASARLNLPFELLNDSQLELTRAMNLPTFEYELSTYIKRITIISEDGVIKKTFYPVFPPDKNVSDVIEWFEHNNALQPTPKGGAAEL